MKLATVTRSFAKCLLAALVAVACTAEAVTNEQAPTTSEPVSSLGIIPGIATVEFTEDMTALIEGSLQQGSTITRSADLNAILANLGAVSLERVFPDAGPFEGRTRRAGLHRFYKVVFSDRIPATKAVTDLSQLPGVVSVTPSRRIEKRVSFDDPLFPLQWHLVSSIGQADINVKEVWEKYTTGSSQVIVNVVDEPVDITHPDLQANLWRDEEGHTGFNFARNTWDMTIRPEGGRSGKEWYNGDLGHGTFVAGTIAAVNNNSTGVCGIAGGDYANNIPGVRIQSSVIFSGYDAYANDDQTANAIKWGADHGAVISQNSWGYVYDEEVGIKEWKTYNISNFCPVIKAAVDYFIEYAGCDDEGEQLPDAPMKGGLVIFASGNDNIEWDIISSYEPIIAVGAYGPTLSKAGYSNYGSWVDVAAPGGVAGQNNSCIWSTVPRYVNDYGDNGGKVIATELYEGPNWQGTSMACPHVSGVAALIASYFGGPGFTAGQCKEILLGGLGKTVGGNRPIGKKLDALASFEYGIKYYSGGGSDPAPPVIKLEKTSLTVKAHLSDSFLVTAIDPNGDKVTITCRPDSDALTFDPETGVAVVSGWKAPAGTYTAVFTATDETGLFSQATFRYTILPNHAPSASVQLADRLLIHAETINSPFFDEDGETPSLQVQAADPTVLAAVISEGSKIVLTPKGNGITTVTVTATDALGASTSQSFRVAVRTSGQSMEIYPVPATTVVYFWPSSVTESTLTVTLYSASGSRVKSAEMPAGVFLPAALDISDLAPGKYTAVYTYDGKTVRETVVKI